MSLERDVVTSGFQWAYDNRAYLNNLADKMYLNKYRKYQKDTERYKQIARGARRLQAKRANLLGNTSNKRMKFSPKRVGDPMSVVSNKREAVQTEVFGALSRNLYTYLLTDIPLGIDNDEIQRRGSSIHVAGISINFGIRNRQGCPLFVNVAVISPSQGSIPSATNFFANDGTFSNTRYIDFAAARTARQLHFSNINSQSYVVLHHARFQLNTTGDGDVTSARANRGGGEADWLIHKKYIPINRTLTYDSSTGDSCTSPIWFVFWCDRWDATSGATPVTNAADAYVHNTTFFKDSIL